ncbi:hypothetical protein PSPO01_03363 [Paraphaeosphaeria sporulosa]
MPATCGFRPPWQNATPAQNTRYLHQQSIKMDARELSIQAAISDYHAGVYTSLRAVAKAYHIPRSTLQGRLSGASNSALSHQHQQRLTPAQEDFLVDWILDEDARACPPSHARAREMANRILRMNGDTQPVGKL